MGRSRNSRRGNQGRRGGVSPIRKIHPGNGFRHPDGWGGDGVIAAVLVKRSLLNDHMNDLKKEAKFMLRDDSADFQSGGD